MAEVAVGVWSAVVEPKKKLSLNPPTEVRLTNVALGDVLADASARTTVKLTHETLPVVDSDNEDDDEGPKLGSLSTFICSLTPGKIEQATVSLLLNAHEEVIIETVGPNKVYLTGNYIEMQNQNMPPFGSELDSEEEEDFDLREVSSDVEMDADELDDEARFEEIDDAVHGAKRPRESDAAAEKTSKKQKSETGQAVKPASEKKDKKDKKKDKSQDQDKKPDEKKSEGASKAVEREIAGGIKIKDSKVGTGPAAKKGNSVSMRYVGRLSTPQGKIFDSNTKGKPFNFQLGKGEVIKGWDEGIVGMQVGGERLLTLPPNMGYGKRGTDGIPGNSTLVFEVKLVSINK